MGILNEPAKFIKKLKLPAGFSVCELGDQWITHTTPHYLAEKFYKKLGCGRYVSIDGNGRGTLTHDLNLALDLETFDLVTDFGTGEHIFDQAQVWRTVHGLTKVGGYIAFDRPAQGYPAHCYYRTDACLFHDVSAANDYEVLCIRSARTKRGDLIRGVFRKQHDRPFIVPQQGRYHKILEIPVPC